MGFFKQLAGRLLAYNDGSQAVPGIDRIQIGDLQPFTDALGQTSPGGPNMRLLDNGNLLVFDALGLIGVLQSAGFAAGASSQSTASTTDVDVTSSTFLISLARPARIDYRLTASGQTTAGAGNGYCRGRILKGDGTTFDTSADIVQGTTGVQTGFMWYFVGRGANFLVLPPDQYTVKLQMRADAGTTYKLFQFFHQIFLAGG